MLTKQRGCLKAFQKAPGRQRVLLLRSPVLCWFFPVPALLRTPYDSVAAASPVYKASVKGLTQSLVLWNNCGADVDQSTRKRTRTTTDCRQNRLKPTRIETGSQSIKLPKRQTSQQTGWCCCITRTD